MDQQRSMTKLTNRAGQFDGYFLHAMLFEIEDTRHRSWVVTSHTPDNESHIFCVENGQFHSASIHWMHPVYGDVIVNHGPVEKLDATEEELVRKTIAQWEQEYDSPEKPDQSLESGF